MDNKFFLVALTTYGRVFSEMTRQQAHQIIQDWSIGQYRDKVITANGLAVLNNFVVGMYIQKSIQNIQDEGEGWKNAEEGEYEE